MGQEVLEKFGSYILLDRIGSGGMAHIFRARPDNAGANGRLLVIKRILPEIAENPFFVNMFRSEIQVAMGFSHPNIPHIYRFGEIDGQAYYAMEYIEGIDLKNVIVAYSERNLYIPTEVTLAVIESAARGLHYAHTFENSATGLSYRLVHRDVSPQNILIAYDGSVKVIDFGIAKAAMSSAEKTRRGIIKGKASYLSPEQAGQKPLDARSDVFSLGIVFWEMLTARKLFSAPGSKDLDVLKLVQNCEQVIVPPSTFNKALPPELDEIVLRALRKNPDERYKSAEELERAIHAYLTSFRPGFQMADVGRLLREIFRERIAEEKKQLRAVNAKAQQALEEGLTLREKGRGKKKKRATPPPPPGEETAKPGWRVSTLTKAAVGLALLVAAVIKADEHFFMFDRWLAPQPPKAQVFSQLMKPPTAPPARAATPASSIAPSTKARKASSSKASKKHLARKKSAQARKPRG